MKKHILSLVCIASFVFISCNQQPVEKYQVQTITENGYTYEIVTNDPLKMRLYTLDNGLKVYISVNKDEPRLQTCIAVKAGSTYDPAETTGLAHYLEHMLFKGTDDIGTLDWESESALLDVISDLYEDHRMTDDPEEKTAIYKKIDSVSTAASKYAIANEFDKMVSAIGAKGTNAFTSNEQTVYINDIPSNELEKWAKLESQRMSNLVLRLFHTELESVYEEFNRGQDNDNRKMYRALLRNIFPNHPYGTQSTIGTSEHLKNPSMVKIHEYFNNYYVPNNMAICLSGDIDPGQTIALLDQYFGNMVNSEVPQYTPSEVSAINGRITEEVLGPDRESVIIGFRFDGINTGDSKMVSMIDMILSNSQAGIIDLDLVQQQKILSGGSGTWFLKEYGIHIFYANAREGQTLEEVEGLLHSALDKVKKGEFEDWMLDAVINDLELSRIKESESNGVAYDYVDAFVHDVPWIDLVGKLDNLRSITKEELVQFANEKYTDDCVVIFKRSGKDTTVAKVENPPITPLELNREDESGFMQEFKAMETKRLDPVFVNYQESIQTMTLGSGIELKYIENTTNDLFSLYYILDMGNHHDKELALAVNYLPYLGTSKYSAAELQQEFYKLGLTIDVFTSDSRSYVYVTGLGKHYEKGVELLEHVLADVQPDQQAYSDYVDGILKKRSDAKLNKSRILWGGLANMVKYGPTSSFTNIISEEELKKIDPSSLTDLLKEMTAYKHYSFYYGARSVEDVKAILDQHHLVNAPLLDYPEKTIFPELDIEGNQVLFAHYDMVQAEVLLMAKDELFNKDLLGPSRVFNEYFGAGLSSIVFQEIREAKGLAYSAFCSFSSPRKQDESHYVRAYVGTQVNKAGEAVPAIIELLQEMPRADKQFQGAKDAILKKIETDRITKSSIFWSYMNNKDRGIDHDFREDIYNNAKDMTLDELAAFFQQHIARDNYVYMVVANRDELDMEVFRPYGEIKEYSLEELFGY